MCCISVVSVVAIPVRLACLPGLFVKCVGFSKRRVFSWLLFALPLCFKYASVSAFNSSCSHLYLFPSYCSLLKRWLLKNLTYLKIEKTKENLLLFPVDRRFSLAWLVEFLGVGCLESPF